MSNSMEFAMSVKNRASRQVRELDKELGKTQKSVDQVNRTAQTAGQAAEKAISQTTAGVRKQIDAVEDLDKAVGAYQDKRGRWHSSNGRFLPSESPAGIGGNGTPPVPGDPFRPVLGSAVSLAAAGYAAKKAWSFTWDQATQAALQKTQKTTMQALLQHKEAGSALYDYVSAYAKVSALGREDLANATTAYMTYTHNADQLERMLKLTERLYAKDPSQGAQGAAFAMKELLAGDTMSIKDRFNMTGISGAKIREFSQTGDIEGMLDYIDAMFNKFGATQEVVDANFDNLTTQANIFTSNLSTAMAESANPAMETLAGMVKRLNQDMDAGKFQPFFALMSRGMQAIATGVAWVGEHLNVIVPIVGGVVTALVIYKGAQMAATITTGILSIATKAMTGNFIGAGIALASLVGGIVAFNELGKKVDFKTGADLSSLKNRFAGFEKELPKLPDNDPMLTKITNSAPISVKGEVEIEEESMKYLLDIQGQQWLAKFTTATLAPQNVFYGTTIRETVDFDEFSQKLTDDLATAIEVTGEA